MFRTSTLRDSLGVLPLGFYLGGDRLRDISFKPYTTEFDLLLNDIRSVQSRGLYEILHLFLTEAIANISGYSLKELAAELGIPMRRIFSEMFLVDVLFIVLNLRIISTGEAITFSSVCPSCSYEQKDSIESGFYHELGDLDIVSWEGIAPLEVSVEIDAGTLLLKPSRFASYPQLTAASASKLELETLYSQCHPQLNDRSFQALNLNLCDRAKLFAASRRLSQIAPDIAVANFCRRCRAEWEVSLPWEGYEDFYSNLISPPPTSYLQELLVHITFGEQAPCKSISEAKQLPVKERDFWVNRISELYSKQKEEMDKSSRKGKSRKTY